jgi:hypothetical protein
MDLRLDGIVVDIGKVRIVDGIDLTVHQGQLAG